nr:copia protein [Tanacetum cinerariifolium]
GLLIVEYVVFERCDIGLATFTVDFGTWLSLFSKIMMIHPIDIVLNWSYHPMILKLSLMSFHDDGFKPSSDDGKKVDEDLSKGNECYDQEKEDNVNNTNNVNPVSSIVNAASTDEVNTIGEPSFDPDMPALEDISTFNFSNKDEDDDVVADINNLDTTIHVSPTPTTRIHKDHPLDKVIRDLHSATQTRNMKKNLEEHGAIGIKWAFKNEKDEKGIVIRNKAKLVAQGHTQKEGIGYDEVFVPVARIEAIRLFLDYASLKDFVVYQMDVKSAFLYEKIEEEVYVCQPPGFENLDFPDRVYKVKKALYRLHQAPKAWKELCNAFEKLMQKKFQMSSMGELTFFLRLQVKQKNDGIFISQDKYVGEIFKKFRIFRYLKGHPKLGLWYPKDSSFDLVAYTDSDYAGASLDRKSTTGGCQFLKNRLISWQCKKQTMVANSTTEDKYNRGLDLENTKTTQALEIDSLKRRVKKLEKKQRSSFKEVSVVDEVNAVSTATTTTITIDDITLAKALMEIKSAKPKADKVVIQELEQELFDKAIKRVNTIVDYKTELVVESLKEAEAEMTEGSSKRAGEELEHENAKKQKMGDDKESAELKQCLEIILKS